MTYNIENAGKDGGVLIETLYQQRDVLLIQELRQSCEMEALKVVLLQHLM